MGKASSSKKVARAARAAGRPGAKRSYVWPVAIGAVVLAGVVLVVLSFGSGDSSLAPRLTDHWHEAYGIYNCNAYLTNLPEQVNSGIHTHGDGLIHVEPSSSAETGKNANLATFVKGYPGLAVSQTEIKVPNGPDLKDGGKCGDKPANVKLFVWPKATDKAPTEVTDPTDKILIKDGAAIAFAFVPDGVVPPVPPSVTALGDPNAGEGGGATTTPSPSTVPGSTPPTTGAGSSAPVSPATSAPAPSTSAPATTAKP